MLDEVDINMLKILASQRFFPVSLTHTKEGLEEYIKHINPRESIKLSSYISPEQKEMMLKNIESLGFSPSERGGILIIDSNMKKIISKIKPQTFNINSLVLPKNSTA